MLRTIQRKKKKNSTQDMEKERVKIFLCSFIKLPNIVQFIGNEGVKKKFYGDGI